MQLPSVFTNSLLLPLYAANIGTMTYPFLTIAAGNMLHKAGSAEQVRKYLEPMLEGRFFGTMNLSEPQAGSSLGDITTKAFPLDSLDSSHSKGSDSDRDEARRLYAIKGTKMWISGGEHALSENIVHMVLAKVSDPAHPERTPSGVKGISLFVVPKFRVEADGSLGRKNGIELVGLNKKMGWRGATNCVLNYGEDEDEECVGELLGKEGEGLKTMFLMMNEARISIGIIATALGYAGLAQSLQYALERKQGRHASNKDPDSPQVSIASHSDVKRMILAQKAYVEGSLALCLLGSVLVDKDDDDTEAKLLLDVLTPIIKSWPSEWCLEANKWAIQVHGGYGYTRDYAVEQHCTSPRLSASSYLLSALGPWPLGGRVKYHIESKTNCELWQTATTDST